VSLELTWTLAIVKKIFIDLLAVIYIACLRDDYGIGLVGSYFDCGSRKLVANEGYVIS
jgi:hypothetical protein